MNRRDLLKIGAATTVFTRDLGAQQPHDHAAPAPSPVPTLVTKDPNWKPVVFDDHQNQTVVALTETIIPRTDTPGAADAKVNRYIDLFLSSTEAHHRNEFISGLNWLDGCALRQHHAPFVRCNPEQQAGLLSAMDAEKEGPGHNFFVMAKTMTGRIYYSTEEGYKELNKDNPQRNVGCVHGGHA